MAYGDYSRAEQGRLNGHGGIWAEIQSTSDDTIKPMYLNVGYEWYDEINSWDSVEVQQQKEARQQYKYIRHNANTYRLYNPTGEMYDWQTENPLKVFGDLRRINNLLKLDRCVGKPAGVAINESPEKFTGVTEEDADGWVEAKWVHHKVFGKDNTAVTVWVSHNDPNVIEVCYYKNNEPEVVYYSVEAFINRYKRKTPAQAMRQLLADIN